MNLVREREIYRKKDNLLAISPNYTFRQTAIYQGEKERVGVCVCVFKRERER